MRNLINAQGEICLYGFCGDLGTDYWTGEALECFTAWDVMMAINTAGAEGGPITFCLNSGGGYASEGVAIYNAIRAYSGPKTIKVVGMAYSAASLILCAAIGDNDKRIMLLGSTIMIHDPATFTAGTQQEHEKSVAMLKVMGDSTAQIYAKASDQTVEQCRADMIAELWMTADIAVEKGYADQIDDDGEDILDPPPFPYTLYKAPPQQLATMSVTKGWDKIKLAQPSHAPDPNRVRQSSAPPLDIVPTPAVEPRSTPESDPIMTVKTTEQIAAENAATAATQAANMRASKIVGLCQTEGFPNLAERFLNSPTMTVEAVTLRLAECKQITMAVDAARKIYPTLDANLATQYVIGDNTLQGVQADLHTKAMALQAALGRPTQSVHAAEPANAGGLVQGNPPIDAATIYMNRNKARMSRAPGKVTPATA